MSLFGGSHVWTQPSSSWLYTLIENRLVPYNGIADFWLLCLYNSLLTEFVLEPNQMKVDVSTNDGAIWLFQHVLRSPASPSPFLDCTPFAAAATLAAQLRTTQRFLIISKSCFQHSKLFHARELIPHGHEAYCFCNHVYQRIYI